jgi:hypothetical protein
MLIRSIFAVALTVLSGTVAAAQADTPCAACVALLVSPDETRAIAPPGTRLDDLPVIIIAEGIDDGVRTAVDWLKSAGAAVGVELPISALSSVEPARLPDVSVVAIDGRRATLDDQSRFVLRMFAVGARAARAEARLGLDLLPEQLADPAVVSLGVYFDIIISAATAGGEISPRFPGVELWTMAPSRASTIADVVSTRRFPGSDRVLARLAPGREGLAVTIAALRTVLPAGLTPLPDVTVACDDGACEAATFLNPQTLDAVAIVRPRGSVTRVTVTPPATAITVYGNPTIVVSTSVPARGTEVGQASLIDLPSVTTPFVMRIQGWRGASEGGFATDVQVSGARQLRVDEIIARHQAAQARQNAAIRTVVADGSTVLTFQVPGFAAPFTITAKTRVFTGSGETTVEHMRIRVNGLDIAGGATDVPHLPLLEPERVTTPPLTIALTEAYRYELRGRERVDGRDAYLVAFDPRMADRSLFAGRAWIDTATFGIVRTDASQTALRGPIAASRQVDEFERVDTGATPTWLLRRSEVFQVYAGPSESTPIHRVVRFDRNEVNRADYDEVLGAALRSNAVMLRDTPSGYRFLLPNRPGSGSDTRRVSSSKVDRITTGVVGGLFDPNISVPLVFAGVSYIDFNLFNTGAQVNAFFGGTYGRFSWSTPPLLGVWRLTGDGSGVALSYNDRAFRGGVEHYEENIRQRPAQVSLALLGTLAPALRMRVGYELTYTKYARAPTTAPEFVVPASTPVHGVHLALETERGAWSASGWLTIARRQTWTAWGTPASRTEGGERRFDRIGGSVARSIVWSPRAVGRVEAAVMSGRHLDRFSRFAFGTFDNPLRGYPSVSIRYDRGVALRSVATWTPASRVRLDAFGDLGVVRAPDDSRARAFPGVGAALEMPAPRGWLASVEWGYGARGVNTDGTTGTHVIRVSGYKVF